MGKHFFKLAAALFIFTTVAPAGEPARITIHAGARQTFKGFGTSAGIRLFWDTTSVELRTKFAKLLWEDTGFRYLRLWGRLNKTGDELADGYAIYITDTKAVQPDLKLVLAATGSPTDTTTESLRAYAAHYAQVCADMKKRGFPIFVTGVSNEPDNNPEIPNNKIAELVRFFREELDLRGCSEVGIIAPENCNLDAGALDMFAGLVSDSAALAGLQGFAVHSYNMGMLRILRDKLQPYKKELWQTESSDNGPECNNDGKRAVVQAGRFLCDVNLGVQYWFHFLGHEADATSGCGGDAAVLIIAYHPNGSFRILLKYYYYKQLHQAFPVGSVFRTATSDLGRLAADSSRWHNGNTFGMHADKCTYMEYTYGPKPPIASTAAVAPDSSWNIGIANMSGCRHDALWNAEPEVVVGYYLNPTVFDVTVFVEELAGIDSIPFQVYRSDTNATIAHEGSAMMRNGEVTVFSNPFSLVTLRSEAPVAVAPRPTKHTSSSQLRLTTGGKRVIISAARSEEISALLYTASGKHLAGIAGRHVCSFNIGSFAEGVYIVKVVRPGNAPYMQTIILQ